MIPDYSAKTCDTTEKVALILSLLEEVAGVVFKPSFCLEKAFLSQLCANRKLQYVPNVQLIYNE